MFKFALPCACQLKFENFLCTKSLKHCNYLSSRWWNRSIHRPEFCFRITITTQKSFTSLERGMEMSGKPKADLSFPDNVAVQGDRKYLETYQNKNFEAKNNSCIPERKKEFHWYFNLWNKHFNLHSNSNKTFYGEVMNSQLY